MPQRDGIFSKVAKEASRRGTQSISKNPDAVSYLLRILVSTLPARAYDGHIEAPVNQRATFLPNPPVERNR
jgi:hypothetical protein